MTLRKSFTPKGFTLVEMLVVIMIIAILAAALFPAINAAIQQAKSTAMKNRGRGIWTAVVSANAEREPLGMSAVWPGFCGSYVDSTTYFQFLIGGGTNTIGGAVCEDLKPSLLTGSGMPTAPSAAAFDHNVNAWCAFQQTNSSASISVEDAFIYSRNIDFGSGIANGSTVQNSDKSFLTTQITLLNHFNLTRGVYVTFGGGCIDRRDKYIGVDSNNSPTNNLVNSSSMYVVLRPAAGE